MSQYKTHTDTQKLYKRSSGDDRCKQLRGERDGLRRGRPAISSLLHPFAGGVEPVASQLITAGSLIRRVLHVNYA